MNVEELREYCLSKPAVSESFPFDEKTIVFKVGGKMFALADIEDFSGANLKCDPERAVELREAYQGIKPGWHMNKMHWNTVEAYTDVDDTLFYELIDHSYALVKNSLTKKARTEYGL